MVRSTDQALAGLLADLPKGWAWRRDPVGVGAGLLRPQAAELAALEASMEALLAEADPRTTTLLIDEWERAFGLPDECSGDPTSLTERRVALIARLVAGGGPTLATFLALAQVYGVTASITEHRPHTCEDHCEYPVYDEGWAFAWEMFSPVGEGLPHECAVRRIAPAYSVPIFTAYRRLWSMFSGIASGGTLRRPAPADRIDYRGKTVSAGIDVARFDYDPSPTYNAMADPWFDGAISGGLPAGCSEAQNPTYFTPSTVLGVDTDGIPYADITLSGTPATTAAYVLFLGPNEVAAVAGQAVAASLGICILSGGTLGTATVQAWLQEADGDACIPGIGTGAPATIDTVPQRAPITRTFSNGATNNARIGVRVSGYAAGVPLNFTVRVQFPVLHQGAAPITNTVPLATLAKRFNGIPQYGFVGLLVEPSEAEQLILGMPDGTYDMTVRAGTVSVAGTNYAASAEAIGGFGVVFAWPADAVTAAERHVQTITLIKVS